ncbi:unnamed protein product [Cuscuta epithymum]|uniref:Uncharacterized protein n=1 Tax=Cuscuta epithymum TaxID=186058 RepID=A0AAV0CVK1_9ASTE|nr:unnamed protein product [Cuscuta epithymum]
MQYDRPLSAIVPSSRSARPSLPGWRRTSYASRSAPQRHRVQIHGSPRPFPPGWRRPSYAVRSALQRHRTQLTFSSSIPFQGGDDRLMQYDRPLSAIVPSSRSARPSLSGWRRTSYASRSASQRHRVSFTFGSPHSLQDGDERLMQYDRPLSAIVPSSRSARPSLSGWRRTSYASRSASQRHRVSFTFGSPHSLQDGDERLMQYDRPLSAIVPGFTVRLAHSLQNGDDRLMRHDRLLSAIVSLSRSARPFLSGWRRTSLMQHDQRPSAIVSGSR